MFTESKKGLPGPEIFQDTLSRFWGRMLAAVAALFLAPCCGADGDYPFFVTYTSQMEDPRELEIETRNVTGKPGGGTDSWVVLLEFEYGATSWWTTELYLDGQSTANENTVFTGYRWENRFRLFPEKHWLNPVLYFEFENLNGANKSLLEIVGHDGVDDLNVPTDEARRELERSIEGRLILDSSFKDWTIAGNLIVEEDVRHEPYEFGYTIGLYRPLGGATRLGHCNLCLNNVQAGRLGHEFQFRVAEYVPLPCARSELDASPRHHAEVFAKFRPDRH